jgi:hypothetical protein
MLQALLQEFLHAKHAAVQQHGYGAGNLLNLLLSLGSADLLELSDTTVSSLLARPSRAAHCLFNGELRLYPVVSAASRAPLRWRA